MMLTHVQIILIAIGTFCFLVGLAHCIRNCCRSQSPRPQGLAPRNYIPPGYNNHPPADHTPPFCPSRAVCGNGNRVAAPLNVYEEWLQRERYQAEFQKYEMERQKYETERLKYQFAEMDAFMRFTSNMDQQMQQLQQMQQTQNQNFTNGANMC